MGAVSASKQGQESGVNLTIQMLGGTITLAAALVSSRMLERPALQNVHS